MPATDVVRVPLEGSKLTLISSLRTSLEWSGVVVHVFEERWNLDVVSMALDILLQRHLHEYYVDFCEYGREVVALLSRWMDEFGILLDVILFDTPVGSGGVECGRVISFSVFTWAVWCGVISEMCLHGWLGSLRGLLCLANSLCSGPGLVGRW